MSAPNLPTDRELSNIPSQQGKWFYPSEHQFYKASVAKGHDVDTKDMTVVVAIHNAVNERAWHEIMKYEKTFHKECEVPKLIRFVGRPGEWSKKAYVRNFFGSELPFDRHDWYVDRCGKSVRYIVDFYDGQPTPMAPVSMFLDTRPALDSFGDFVDRIRMGWLEFSGQVPR